MRVLKKAVTILATCTMLAALCACGKGAQDKTQYTITFMNGAETLGTASVSEGKTIDKQVYSKYEQLEGLEFVGWYETPGYLDNSRKDLSEATFTKDTTLYGCYKSANVTEDTRLWYLAGTSEKGLLKLSKWAGEVEDSDKEQLQLTSTQKADNEFAITIDLFAGDQFQIIHDWAWDDQKGFGCITAFDETQIESGGGLGGTDETANANVIMDGNYTITLTTDPDNSALDTIEIVRNGEPLTEGTETIEEDTFEVTEDTTVSVKGSWVEDWSELKELTRTEGNTYTITLELEEETELCFSVFEAGEDTGIVLKGENVTDDASKQLLKEGNNVVVSETGTYLFTVDLDKMTVVVSK